MDAVAGLRYQAWPRLYVLAERPLTLVRVDATGIRQDNPALPVRQRETLLSGFEMIPWDRFQLRARVGGLSVEAADGPSGWFLGGWWRHYCRTSLPM
ncbi:MAG: hypothetical protein D6722_15275 [Bacteroidetes bacterium]|nr:MAG: hypothetical protein D6722_15275 [Bacteroidota bacterium]